jgi:hypothetical protein
MDDNYKDFVDGGPIPYITKLDIKEMQVIGERYKMHFIWPKQGDLKGKKVLVSWANGAAHFERDVDPTKETNFVIENLEEGSYIFQLILADNLGNQSVPVTVTGTVYGETWEMYQPNRIILSSTQEGKDRKISFNKNSDSRIQGMTFEWMSNDDTTPRTKYIPASETEGVLENFAASSYRYRTHYIPETGGVDVFLCPWQYYTGNVSAAEVDAGFDKPTNSFTLPIPNDANWIGYEFRWQDVTTGENKSQRTTTPDLNKITLSDYNGVTVRIHSLFKYGDAEASSVALAYNTARFTDLDRSKWYAAPEKMADGTEVDRVMDFLNQAASTAGVKSPYLSHKLPFAAAAPDGATSPRAHFDNNPATYLSQVKGSGTTWETNRKGEGTVHSNGGVSSDGNDVYFIIDLGEKVKFNYYRLQYRTDQANANLKPQGLSFYGSNDPSCVNGDNDESKWTVIQEGMIPPGCTSNQSGNADDVSRITGNVTFPTSDYRYVKVRYDAWNNSSNTMQTAEFWLGYYQ